MARGLKCLRKDPDAVLDYGFDWNDTNAPGGPWLAPDEVIETSTWTVPDGITASNENHDDGSTLVWLSGGEAGITYRISNRITTSAGRTDERSFDLAVEDR